MKNAIIKVKRFDSIKSFEQIMGEIVSMSDSDETTTMLEKIRISGE